MGKGRKHVIGEDEKVKIGFRFGKKLEVNSIEAIEFVESSGGSFTFF